jgi:HEAT repeat protein
MNHPAYPTILQQFSQIEGDPYEVDAHNLLPLGITVEMIPDLIDTILDEKYYEEDDSIEGYPHLFAYIALGQLKTPAAIDGLIAGVTKWADSDWFEWFCEAMPDIFGSIGSIAIEPLIPILQDKTLNYDVRSSAIHYLHSITVTNPDERDRCVATISKELEQFDDNDPELNGYIVMALVADFKAVETAPIIEAAYTADRVAMAFLGDWEDVQLEFGLITERTTPSPNYGFGNMEDFKLERAFAQQSQQIDSIIQDQEKSSKNTKAKDKAKRKQQKKSRQKNRRK